MKILIVDDNEDYLIIVDKWLKNTKHEYKTINNPYDAITLIKNEGYDIVIVDLYMSGMSGIKLIDYIKKNFKYIPVILISNGNLEQYELRYKYTKPNFIEDFYKILEEVISKEFMIK